MDIPGRARANLAADNVHKKIELREGERMQIAEKVSDVSALEHLDIRAMNGPRPTGEDLLLAIAQDVSRSLPLSKTLLLKHVAGNHTLSESQVRRALAVLKEGMVNAVEVSPEVFLTYSHAAIICVNELGRR